MLYSETSMKRETIIKLAREAKGHPYTSKYLPGETAFAFSIDRLEHFTKLIIDQVLEEVRDEVQFHSSWDTADQVTKRVNERFGIK